MLYNTQLHGRLFRTSRIVALSGRLVAISFAGAVLAAASGCNYFHRTVKAAVIETPSKHDVMIPVDLTKFQPNEAGKVPVIMYHNIKGTAINEARLEYPPKMFRDDLEWLYAHNYRPVSLTQYVQGKIDCPAGKSPVILTFDDGLRSQYALLADGKTDPDCAVGILEDFHAKHPDWQLRGTFFVLTDEDPKMPPPFYQKEYAQGKLEQLVKDGFDIGNHTVHHRKMSKLDDKTATAEMAGAVAGIHKYLPDYDVNTTAMPYGLFPKNKKIVVSGQADGVAYHDICAMAAAYRPIPSPIDKGFNPYHLERMTAGVKFHESRWWLNDLETTDKADKFVSDGDPNTFTVNSMASGMIDKSAVQKMHLHLRTYNGTQIVASR